MAEAKIRIRIKRGTSNEWSTTNPILGLGEIGWLTDTGRWFCGDGVHTFTEIFGASSPYLNQIWANEQTIYAYVENATIPIYLNLSTIESNVSQLQSDVSTISIDLAGVLIDITNIEQDILDLQNADATLQNNIDEIPRVAIPYSADHINGTSNQYKVKDVVYYDGAIYQCIADNDSIIPTDTNYWTLLYAGGFPLIETPADWDSTSGNNQILNKPTIIESITDDAQGIVNVDNTDPLNPIVGFGGVYTDGITMSGNGTALSPLASFGADTYLVKATATDGNPSTLDAKIYNIDGSLLISQTNAGGFEYLDTSVAYAPRIIFPAKNTDSVTINIGDPVYIRGMVGATNRYEIGRADASDPAKMPSVGIAGGQMSPNAEASIIAMGSLLNITTDPIDGVTPTPNQTLYVKAGGGLTTTKPIGTNLIQNIGKVGKVSGGGSGSVVVSAIMRTNDLPNIATGKMWIGNADSVPTAQTMSGDATISTSGVLTISNDAVTYAKIQDVSATKRLLGRVSAGAGNVEEVELSSDGTLGGLSPSGSIVSSQSAIKNYVDVGLATKEPTLTKGNVTTSSPFVIVGGTNAVIGSGVSIDMNVANSITNGYLSWTDWNTFNNKQATLVSGTNIKTINGLSILGSGDLDTGYTLNVQALTSAPTDGQTIYFGALPKAPTTTANISKVYIPRAGVIKRVEIHSYSGTAGTSESWSMYIRLNNTTDTLVKTNSINANERRWENHALNISVVAGDYIEIKLINPTWATNPNTIIFGGHIYIE
jgi:hypothetical protein